MIGSMTPYERRNPSCLNGSRKQRIAAGSGHSIQDVNRFVKQFEETRKMMKAVSTKGKAPHMPRRRKQQCNISSTIYKYILPCFSY
jgi:signal recognition particle subunit SRP54